MPKSITIEMLEAMSPDELKSLHKNAQARESDAARDLLALIAGSGLMAKPASGKSASAKSGAAKSGAAKSGAAKPRVVKKKTSVAVHGRQA